MVDTHQKILNVRTPPGSAGLRNNKDVFMTAVNNEAVRVKRENSAMRTYRKDAYGEQLLNCF